MRTFETGATRDNDAGKLDFEGFLSYPVLRRFAEYMDEHRVQADGNLRDSDNWQRGIPREAYMKSAWRHFIDWWAGHRQYKTREELEEAICALIFNAQGYLHELLKDPSTVGGMTPAQERAFRGALAKPTMSDDPEYATSECRCSWCKPRE